MNENYETNILSLRELLHCNDWLIVAFDGFEWHVTSRMTREKWVLLISTLQCHLKDNRWLGIQQVFKRPMNLNKWVDFSWDLLLFLHALSPTLVNSLWQKLSFHQRLRISFLNEFTWSPTSKGIIMRSEVVKPQLVYARGMHIGRTEAMAQVEARGSFEPGDRGECILYQRNARLDCNKNQLWTRISIKTADELIEWKNETIRPGCEGP